MDDSEKQEERKNKLINALNGAEGKMYRLARKIVGNSHDAEEVVQDVFAHLMLGSIDRYDPSRPFEPWVLTITGNRSKDFIIKKQIRANHGIYDAIGDDYGPGIHPSSSPNKSPPSQSEESEQIRIMKTALARLPQMYRRVIELASVGESVNRIAQLEQIPLGTAKSRLYTARSLAKRDQRKAYSNL